MPDSPSFAARLSARCREVDSLLCVGLDPHPEDLPTPSAEAARDACLAIIRATASFAAAFKPNAAFFEAWGAPGWAALKEVIEAVPSGIPVILDAKRGDIGSTARAYARSCFDELGADAVTLHGWMGHDSVAPFAERADRGAFLLCRTSNPGAAELLDRQTVEEDGRQVHFYEALASRAAGWSDHANLGLVVGATSPDAMARVRRAAPEAWILAPGVGAQGGSLDQAVRAGLRSDGLGVLVSVSRGISRSADPAQAAEGFVTQIRSAVAAYRPPPAVDPVAEGLLNAGCVRFGSFTLKSGLKSPIYLDLRRLIAHPELMRAVAERYAALLRDLSYDVVAPLPYAALPIGTAVCLQMGAPMVFPRKEAKSYGTKALVEGVFEEGQTAVVLDDLATTGESKFEAVARLEQVGLAVADVVVLIDRESGAREAMAGANLRMHSVYTITQLLDLWVQAGRITEAQDAEVRAFLQGSGS